MAFESIAQKKEGREAMHEPHVVHYAYADVRAREKEGHDYPNRSLVRLLLDTKMPPIRQQGVIERIKGGKPERVAMINGHERRIVPVDAWYLGEHGILLEDGISASEMLSDILITKGLGPCTFTVGFQGARGFLTHNFAGNVTRQAMMRLFGRYGIKRGDSTVELFVGGGMESGGHSGSARRASLSAAKEYGLHVTDIGAQSDASDKSWETGSVAVDPQTRTIVVLTHNGPKQEGV